MQDDVNLTPVLIYLRGAKDAAVQAQRHNLRAQRFWEACTRVTTSLTGMPGGSSSTREDKLALYCSECDDELSALWRERAIQQDIAFFIESISNPVYRYILQFKYLDYLTWNQVVDALESVGIYYTERHVRKLHRAALCEAAKIYEAMEK